MEEQAWILRSLLDQLDSKETDDASENSLAEEFLRLKKQSIQYRSDKTYPTKVAEHQENIKKNRYKDIVPFDHTRVKLSLNTGRNGLDYINASFIKGVSGSWAYIATQGPLPHTVLDFWRMLWEYEVQVVVMACREFEMGRKKCERYWPETQAEPFVCEPFTVYCDSEQNKGDYLTRTLSVTYQNCSRTLHQLHYVNWPDHGVPASIPPILQMIDEMRSHQDHDQKPICIHCSAGCGRTGVLCVIDYTWNLLKRQMIPADFSIYDLVQNMRTQRPSVVQTKEQYEVVYKTIKFLFEKYLQFFDDQTCQKEVAAAWPSLTAAGDAVLSDPSEESQSVLQLKQQLRHQPDPESHPGFPLMENQVTNQPMTVEGSVVQQFQTTHTDHSVRNSWSGDQQLHRPQSLFEAVGQDGSRGPDSRCALSLEGRTEEMMEDGEPPPKPALPLMATTCLTVEDPYFESQPSSPLTEEELEDFIEDLAGVSQSGMEAVLHAPSLALNGQSLELNPLASGKAQTHTDDDTPPPLPVRTPDSLVLAVDPVLHPLEKRWPNTVGTCLHEEHAESNERLAVIIPPNAAALAVMELGDAEKPPSPVPPLPERTPASFELAIDAEDPGAPSAALNQVGVCSERCCDSAKHQAQEEHKPWTRSSSLKVNMKNTALPAAPSPVPLQISSSLLPPPPPPPSDTPTPPHAPQATEAPIPAPPQTTPDLLIRDSQHMLGNTPPCWQDSQTTLLVPRIGMSSEWSGSSQPKRFLDVFMRSKSVRAKSSRHEPLALHQPTSLSPMVSVGAGSEVPQGGNSMSTEAPGDQKDSGKGMSRAKSLKFFRRKAKTKAAALPDLPQSGPPNGTSTSLFKFGFGNRFGKPKGPRSHPDTWQ